MDILEMVEMSVKAGGAGVSIGRNAFQHKNPTAMVKAICMVVHEGVSARKAAHTLAGKK